MANVPLQQSGGGGGGAAAGVSSLTGDSVAYNNSGSTGAVTLSLISQIANSVFAGPTSGGAVAPTWRVLVAGDIPNIAESQVTNLTTDLAAKQPNLTGTGLARNTGACTELSGDLTTSGSNAATIKSSVALAGSPTTTTQSANDNSTKIATTAYADRNRANVSTSGQGYLVCCNLPITGISSLVGVALVSAGQKVRCIQFVLPFAITITKVRMRVSTLAGVAATVTIGLYSADGNTKLVDSGTFNGNTVTTLQTNTIGAVTLQPGVYWYVWSASTQTTLQGAGMSGIFIASTTEAPSGTPLYGEAANSASSGVLPSTLGAITATTMNVLYGLFEP